MKHAHSMLFPDLKRYVFFCIILSFLSCGQQPEKPGRNQDISLGIANKTVLFESANNGTAQIQLKLLHDGSLRFTMETIPQPGTEERSEFISREGHWEKPDSVFRLVFQQKNLVLESLFDESFDAGNTFVLINDSTVHIPVTAREVWIWGVPCERYIY